MPVSQGLGPSTGTPSFLPYSTEQAIAEPKFRRKGPRPPLLMEGEVKIMKTQVTGKFMARQ